MLCIVDRRVDVGGWGKCNQRLKIMHMPRQIQFFVPRMSDYVLHVADYVLQIPHPLYFFSPHHLHYSMHCHDSVTTLSCTRRFPERTLPGIGFVCIPVFIVFRYLPAPTLVSHFSLLIQKCKLCANAYTSVCFKTRLRTTQLLT